jgi:hypothetical protein
VKVGKNREQKDYLTAYRDCKSILSGQKENISFHRFFRLISMFSKAFEKKDALQTYKNFLPIHYS